MRSPPARRISSTPTSSIRIDARSPSPKPTSARARSPCRSGPPRTILSPRTTRSSCSRFPPRSSSRGCSSRRLTGDGGAAATASILFAFCPYVFAHTAHIQLLMVAGIPLSLLAFHRLVDAPSPRARRGARSRARRAGDVVRVLRRLGRPDHRVCHALLRVVAAPVDDDTLLDRDRHRRRVVARHRGAVLPAVPGDPGRDRLRALARRCAAVVGVRAVVSGVGGARARLDAAAHPRMERGRALSRFPLDRPGTRRRRDRASRAERPRRDAAAFRATAKRRCSMARSRS